MLVIPTFAVFAAVAHAPSTSAASTSSTPDETDTYTEEPSSTSSGGDDDYGEPEDNDVYRTGTMRSVGCTARLRSTQPGPYERYLRTVVPCLNKAWKAQLAKQGIAFEEPSLVTFRGAEPTSPCGGGDDGYVAPAFYCSSNQTMYFNLAETRGWKIGEAAPTAPHEYGHHVQNLTGIEEEWDDRADQAEDGSGTATPTETQLSRRGELQADCFAAVFLGANSSTMGFTRQQIVSNTGGDDYVDGIEDHPEYRTHGTAASSRHWLRRGWPSNPGACNTWTASRSAVA